MKYDNKTTRQFGLRKRSYEIRTPTGGYKDCRKIGGTGDFREYVPTHLPVVAPLTATRLVITGNQPELYKMISAVVKE